MKRFFALLTAFVLAVAAYAQTAEEIIAKMDEAMSQVSEENGFRMTMDLKIPILGTMSTNAWTLGDKMRLEAKMMGKQLITWEDGETEWTYDADENTITIENQDKTKKSDEKENMKMFQSATEGYDVAPRRAMMSPSPRKTRTAGRSSARRTGPIRTRTIPRTWRSSSPRERIIR